MDALDEVDAQREVHSDNYALRLTAALEAISAAQRTQDDASSAARASVPAPALPTAVAEAPARPLASAGRGFGTARAAAVAAYAPPVLDLASDEDAHPAPLTPSERAALTEVTTESPAEPQRPEAPAMTAPKRGRARAAKPRLDAAEAAAPAATAAPVRRARSRGRTEASQPSMAVQADVAPGVLDFSAFPQVTQFGTPEELRERSEATATQTPGARGFGSFLSALDKLPPIRLPIGPAIPWRFGLPAMVALLAVMLVVNRPTAHAETQGVHLPASETYAVQQEAPLFQKSTDAQSSQAGQSAQPVQTPQAAPVGVPDNTPTGGMDFLDIMLKMVAVLGLAYGSLSLLKRAGVGGAAATSAPRPGALGSNVRVITSLALAPNRSVHVLQVAGGKTLLLGATPNQVNLLADLGEVNLDTPAAEANFLDILTSKLAR